MPHLSLPAAGTPKPTAQELLEQWLQFCAEKDMDPINEKGAPFYHHFWNTWLAHLHKGRVGQGDDSPPAIQWDEVTAADIVHFLESGPQARKEEEGVSDITRRRYWRLLERIYAFACTRGWLAVNPVLGVTKEDTPMPEAPEGAIILDKLWRAAIRTVQELDTSEPVLARNKALLMLLFHYGVTPQEVRTLTLDAVIRDTESHSGRAGKVVALQIDGAGPSQRRRLVLVDSVADALDDWLAMRPGFANARAHSVIFCSLKNPTMSPDNLFVLVKSVLKVAAAASGQEMPVRMGPQVVRNTCLVRWLEAGVPAPEVAMRAGLKNIKGLYHLRIHVNPEIRITLRNVRDDAPLEQAVVRAA